MTDFVIAENTFFENFNNSAYKILAIYDPEVVGRFALIISDIAMSSTQNAYQILMKNNSAASIDRYFQSGLFGITPMAIIFSTPEGISVINRNFMLTLISSTFDFREFPAQSDIHKKPVELFFKKEEFAFLYLSNASELIDFIKKSAAKNIFINKVVEHFSKTSPMTDTFLFMVNNLFFHIHKRVLTHKIPATKKSLESFQHSIEQQLLKEGSMDEYSGVKVMSVLNELLLNAYEHGVLDINPDEKQQAILQDRFETLLSEREESFDTAHQSIHITIDIYDNNYIALSIKDHGKGFNFYQELPSRPDMYRGRGLLMVKKMSEALFFDEGGTRSTAFLQRLSETRPSDATVSQQSYASRLNLLYVEDNKTTRMLFSEIFKPLFRDLFMAANGEEGFELAKRIKPDLIISDLSMPKMDGLEFARQIRRIYPDIPFMLLTAYDESSELIHAIEIGVDRLFLKPIPDYAVFNDQLEAICKNIYLKKEMERYLLQSALQKENQILTLRSDSDKFRLEHEYAWNKQQLIIHDDSHDISSLQIHLHYQPIEILSGDIYGVIRINAQQSLLYILDGMGKGLSASVTSVLSAAFLNRNAVARSEDTMLDLQRMLGSYCDYIQPYLLEEESISCHFLLMDRTRKIVHYAGFGVYPILIKHDREPVRTIKAKNPPLSRYTAKCVIDEIALPDSFVLLAYSDGLIEHTEQGYATLLQLFDQSDHFAQIKQKINVMLKNENDAFDDDVTLFFVEGFFES